MTLLSAALMIALLASCSLYIVAGGEGHSFERRMHADISRGVDVEGQSDYGMHDRGMGSRSTEQRDRSEP